MPTRRNQHESASASWVPELLARPNWLTQPLRRRSPAIQANLEGYSERAGALAEPTTLTSSESRHRPLLAAA